MKHRERMKGFVLGVLAALLAGMLAAPVLAETAEVVFNTLNIKVNGKQIATAGESLVRDNGTAVPYSIVYNGTTYLPLAKLAEILGAQAQWEASTSSALISGTAGNTQSPFYPDTQYKTFTEVTGTPMKLYYNNDGTAVYVYELISGDSDNALQYMDYLLDSGFALYDTDTTTNSYSITYFFASELDIIFVLCNFQSQEVWVSLISG